MCLFVYVGCFDKDLRRSTPANDERTMFERQAVIEEEILGCCSLRTIATPRCAGCENDTALYICFCQLFALARSCAHRGLARFAMEATGPASGRAAQKCRSIYAMRMNYANGKLFAHPIWLGFCFAIKFLPSFFSQLKALSISFG